MRLFLEGLAVALERGEFVLHYQPQADLRSGKVTGVEALLRWQHPERGLVQPLQFIPLIEQTALVGPVAMHVIDGALEQLARWRDHGVHLTMSVNLSARNLLDPELPRRTGTLLGRHAVPAHRLTVEVTEGATMSDPQRAAAVLGELRALGVGISIDDFGSDSASIAYLEQLPVSELKIDRSFITGMCESAREDAIVRSTIDLARHLDLHVVAEGIETRRGVGAPGGTGLRHRAGLPALPAPPPRGVHELAARAAREPARSHSGCSVGISSVLIGRSSRVVHLRAAGLQHVPGGAESHHALTVGVAGVAVAGEEVERVTLVGDLLGAVGACDRAEVGAHRRAACRGRAARGNRGPHVFAGARAARGCALVAFEHVDRQVLATGRKDRAELAVLGRYTTTAVALGEAALVAVARGGTSWNSARRRASSAPLCSRSPSWRRWLCSYCCCCHSRRAPT